MNLLKALQKLNNSNPVTLPDGNKQKEHKKRNTVFFLGGGGVTKNFLPKGSVFRLTWTLLFSPIPTTKLGGSRVATGYTFPPPRPTINPLISTRLEGEKIPPTEREEDQRGDRLSPCLVIPADPHTFVRRWSSLPSDMPRTFKISLHSSSSHPSCKGFQSKVRLKLWPFSCFRTLQTILYGEYNLPTKLYIRKRIPIVTSYTFFFLPSSCFNGKISDLKSQNLNTPNHNVCGKGDTRFYLSSFSGFVGESLSDFMSQNQNTSNRIPTPFLFYVSNHICWKAFSRKSILHSSPSLSV